MKRPLLTFLSIFLLGELAGQWMESKTVYSLGAAIAAAGIVMRSNRLTAAKSLRNSLLLLFLFVLGFALQYGTVRQFAAEEAPVREAAEAKVSLTLEGVVTESGDATWILRTECGKIRVRIPYAKMADMTPGLSGGEQDTEEKEQAEDVSYGTGEGEGGRSAVYAVSDVRVGDRVRVTGVPERIPASANPGAFDTAAYYESEGIHWQMTAEQTELLDAGDDIWLSFLEGIRGSCREQVAELLPEREAGILLAMLLGERSGVDQELKELYRQSGIAHILAISGLHVSLMGAAVMWLLTRLGLSRKKAGILSILLLVLYGCLTGFSPATLRAVWMLSAVNLGAVLRRTSDVSTSAAGALFVILAAQPYRVTSAGMLMSFLAVAGIVAGDSYWRVIFGKERFLFLPTRLRSPFKRCVSMLLYSVTLQLFLEPVMLRDYYSVTPYSPVVNLLVVPLLTVAVASGAAGLLLSFLPGFLPVARVVLYPCRGILCFYEWICRGMTHVPGHEILTGGISREETMVLLVLVAAGVYGFYLLLRHVTGDRGRPQEPAPGPKRKWRYYGMTMGLVTVCFLLMAGYAAVRNRSRGRIIFLDVGQGDGCIVHTAGGADLLFDCGSSSRDRVGEDVLIPALRYLGIRRLDAVFLSHTDADHVNGVEQLLSRAELYGLQVDTIFLARGTELRPEDLWLSDPVLEGDTVIRYLSRGDEVSCGDATVRVLLPSPGESGTGNDYSMVNLLTVPGVRVLYTGDMGAERELELLQIMKSDTTAAWESTSGSGYAGNAAEEDEGFGPEPVGPAGETGLLPVDILKVAHHGSRYSSCREFLKAWQATGEGTEIAVISCGKRNMYGHPAPETLERLKEAGFRTYRTDREGAVVVELP